MALEGWPPQNGPERDARILAEIDKGNFSLAWCPITIGELTVQVSCDALKIDGVRVNVSARLQQQIADKLGALFLTPKLSDIVYQHASVKIPPSPQPITSSTVGMIAHSARVDALVAGRTGVVADPGKDWVLVRSIFSSTATAARKAANYGWHGTGEQSMSTPSLLVIQDIGTTHNDQHTDYSQIARFVRRQALFAGEAVDMADVYTGKAPGTALVSHEGPLPGARQPGTGPGVPSLPGGEIIGGAVAAAAGSGGAPVALAAAGGLVGYVVAGTATGGAWGAAAGLVVGLLARNA